MSQLKSIKSTLGCSLDQGLDKPVQSSCALGSQSKRICKSEESAIDNKTLVLAKDRSSNSSNETLNSAILNNIDDLTLKNKDNFVKISDKVIIESNIEIMIPTSVSKARNVPDSLESSVSARDRSSNSISSCEMALGSSQNDVDESANDNHIVRREETDDNVFSIDDTLRNVKDAIDSALRNSEHGRGHNSGNDISQNYDTSSTTISEQNSSSIHEQSPLMETAIYSREYFAKSCLSLDDVCTYESEGKQRTKSICSYPEEYTKDTVTQSKHSPESK